MTKYIAIFCAFLSFQVTSAYADQLQAQAMQLAEQGVESKDANGDSQTTVVDANGNLKIMPALDKNGKPLPPAKDKNGADQQNNFTQ